MAEKKNHHYVPQSYQRLFSNDGKSIGIYNIKKNITFNQSSIKNTTCMQTSLFGLHLFIITR